MRQEKISCFPFESKGIYIFFLSKSYHEDFFSENKTQYLKVPLLWVMKGSYFGFGIPQQQVERHARSKNT